MHTLPLESFLLTYLLNSLWQVPLVFGAAWIAARASHRAGPSFQHALWTTALISEIFLPACSASPAELLQAALRWLASFRHTALPQTAQVTITEGPAHAISAGFQLPPVLLSTAAILYLAALLFFATRLTIGLHKTASLRRRAQPLALTGHARQSYHRFAQVFAIPRALVATSMEIAGPITLGIRRPTLLLPAQLDTTLLPEDLDAALAHEFAHMRRRDFAKNLIYELLSLPIAFHPVAWLTRRRMSETRELICDDLAASAVAGRQRYARSLLRLATQFSASLQTPAPHAIGIFDAHPFKNFERRVMHLTHHPIQLRGAARLVPATLSLALIGSACTSALAFRQQVAMPTTQAATVPEKPMHIGGKVTKPIVIYSAAPEYTQEARDANFSGNVLVYLWVDADGNPSHIKVMRGVGMGLDESAVEAISQYKFKPATLEGKPVTVDLYIEQNFRSLPQTASAMAPHGPSPVSDPLPLQATESTPTARISPGVISGQRLNFVAPAYPDDAKAARIQGAVVLHAIIGKDGTIKELAVISGPKELQDSAMNAVKQWTYKPYLLNGEPTAVDTNITVNYALNPSETPAAPQAAGPSASNSGQHPVVIHEVDPIYPADAEADTSNFNGNVIVSLVVGKDGIPKNVAVSRSLSPDFDKSALAAVRQYRFRPALIDGQPVEARLYVDVNFQMRR